MTRTSGVLLHISSLPSPGGIGTLGPDAYMFGDFLWAAGQKYWQLLPLGPTGFGDSPYQNFSTFAGNPYFIDLETLVKEGVLDRNDLYGIDWGKPSDPVDFGMLYRKRWPVLRKAWERQRDSGWRVPEEFLEKNQDWLPDFALFMSLKEHFEGRAWIEWPRELRLREAEALARYKELLKDQIDFHIFLQYTFDKQWFALKDYLTGRGVSLIGDIPIYVPLDCADVWANPEYFQLDEDRLPTAVAGVPPDYFSATGQLWGSPLYRWDRMEEEDFAWWIRRMERVSQWFDVIRIDHFRGFESYWAVPYGEETAINGQWRKGPAMKFIKALQETLPGVQIIAEDLGILTDEVYEMVEQSGYPGMRVMEFAFDSREPNLHLPEKYPENAVVYTGTHDNDTFEGWFAGAPWARDYAQEYLKPEPGEKISRAAIRTLLNSNANLAVIPVQDLLGLGSDARMNTPGTLGGNWQWRLRPGQLTGEHAAWLRTLTRESGR